MPDARTLMILASAVATLSAAAVILFEWCNPARWLRIWTFAILMLAASGASAALHGALPDSVSVILTNAFFAGGLVLTHFSILDLQGRLSFASSSFILAFFILFGVILGTYLGNV